MRKTTICLPDSLKREIEHLARQRSWSKPEISGQEVQDAVGRPEPKPRGIIPGDDAWADQVDDDMEGFGER